MKYSKKNRAMVSGILVGIASIGAVASYFNVEWSELTSFMYASVLFVFAILVLAAVTVVVIKLVGRLLKKLAGSSQDGNSDSE